MSDGRLSGLSSTSAETVTARRTSNGYGIVKVVEQDGSRRLAWMRPTSQIDEASRFASPGEYTLDLRCTWGLQEASEVTRIQMLDVPSHACARSWPCPPEQEQTVLGYRQRFTRSYWSLADGFRTAYEACSECEQPLIADQYLHCTRCDAIFHATCTTADYHHQQLCMRRCGPTGSLPPA
jgi:hypothetical protein